MKLARILSTGLAVGTISALSMNSALAVPLNSTSTTPVAIPSACGDVGTTSSYVGLSGFPLQNNVDQPFSAPQTGTAGVLIIQPGAGVDTGVLHTQLPLAQGNYQQTLTVNFNGGSPNYRVYVAYSFFDANNQQRFGVSLLPSNEVNGSILVNNKSLKGKTTLVNITANTNLSLLRTNGSLVNIAFPGFQPDVHSSNFQLLGIEALITNSDPTHIATAYFNDFALNRASSVFPPLTQQVSVAKDTVDSLSCSSFLVLVP